MQRFKSVEVTLKSTLIPFYTASVNTGSINVGKNHTLDLEYSYVAI